jgi:hypothetical protein
LLHAVGMLCINYYEAFQRKKRANSWNDCHSRIECLDSKSVIKNCWDFVFRACNYQHASTSVWLQAGQYLALALALATCGLRRRSQIPAKQKSGCRPLGARGGGYGMRRKQETDTSSHAAGCGSNHCTWHLTPLAPGAWVVHMPALDDMCMCPQCMQGRPMHCTVHLHCSVHHYALHRASLCEVAAVHHIR